MKFHTVQIEKYGRVVFQHPDMDELRKSQCLCFNCKKNADTCEIALEGLTLCRNFDVAFAMTRCPVFEQKKEPELIVEHPQNNFLNVQAVTPEEALLIVEGNEEEVLRRRREAMEDDL